jgi:hypothetical protein
VVELRGFEESLQQTDAVSCKGSFLMENVVDAGTIQMPPKWALGYHQCRWSYEPAARVAEVSPI